MRILTFFIFLLTVFGLFCDPGIAETAESDVITIQADRYRTEIRGAKDTLPELAKEMGNDFIPLAKAIFANTARSNNPGRGNYLRMEVFDALFEIPTPEAWSFAQAVVSAYLKEGCRAPKVEPQWADEEFNIIVLVGMDRLAKSPPPESWPWLLAVATEDETLDYGARENAYAGFLRAKMPILGLETPEEKAEWLLKQLKTPGNGEWDYFHHNHPSEGKPQGRKQWAIEDSARVTVLAELGTSIAPIVQKEWEELRDMPEKSRAEERKMYSRAAILNRLHFKDKNWVKLPSRAADSMEEWKRQTELLQAKWQRTIRRGNDTSPSEKE